MRVSADVFAGVYMWADAMGVGLGGAPRNINEDKLYFAAPSRIGGFIHTRIYRTLRDKTYSGGAPRAQQPSLAS